MKIYSLSCAHRSGRWFDMRTETYQNCQYPYSHWMSILYDWWLNWVEYHMRWSHWLWQLWLRWMGRHSLERDLSWMIGSRLWWAAVKGAATYIYFLHVGYSKHSFWYSRYQYDFFCTCSELHASLFPLSYLTTAETGWRSAWSITLIASSMDYYCMDGAKNNTHFPFPDLVVFI